MPWAVAAAAIGAYGAISAADTQSSAAKDAGALAQQNGKNANAIEQSQLNTETQSLSPWITTGQNANNVLGGLYNLNGSSAQGQAGTGNFGAFFNSPDYQFALQQGQQALDRSAAARGSLYSGGQNADTIAFGQGLATQQFNNYWNRLSGLSNNGRETATNLAQLGQNNANAQGAFLTGVTPYATNALMNGANASANETNQLAGIAGNLVGQLGNKYGSTGTTGSGFNSLTGSGTYTGTGAISDGSGITTSNYLGGSW
jgi:hypothetical protein